MKQKYFSPIRKFAFFFQCRAQFFRPRFSTPLASDTKTGATSRKNRTGASRLNKREKFRGHCDRNSRTSICTNCCRYLERNEKNAVSQIASVQMGNSARVSRGIPAPRFVPIAVDIGNSRLENDPFSKREFPISTAIGTNRGAGIPRDTRAEFLICTEAIWETAIFLLFSRIPRRFQEMRFFAP